MTWKLPPKIKILEALGSLADGRVEVLGNTAKVYSSSRGKYYEILYDKSSNAIMSNDNGSYWQGYLGYPSIAFLLHEKIIKFDPAYTSWLKGIMWKDINTKFNNDFDKTTAWINQHLKSKGFNSDELEREVDRVYSQLVDLRINVFGNKAKPPSGY